jgi:RNA polymerase sigma factor (sigma-70 family)
VLHCIDLYDPTEEVKFVTYLYTAIENRYQRTYNYYNRKKRTADIISLDTPVNNPGQKTTFIADVVPSDESIEEIVEEKFNRKTLETAMNKYIDKYPKRKYILEQLLYEVNLSEVARNAGVSRQRVSQIYNEFIEYAKNEYFE